jgi:hypothetical protein
MHAVLCCGDVSHLNQCHTCAMEHTMVPLTAQACPVSYRIMLMSGPRDPPGANVGCAFPCMPSRRVSVCGASSLVTVLNHLRMRTGNVEDIGVMFIVSY